MDRVDQRTDHGVGIERMADLDALGFLGDGGRERVVDARLDQKARRRGAALAVERVDHEYGGIGGALEIGIGEHDHRILAAQFEVDAFERVGALPHDQRAGAAFADKTDRLDVGMLGQRLAGVLAHTVDDIPDAGRNAGFVGDLDQQPRA